MDFTVDIRAEVDSTNNVVRQALEAGQSAGYVCRAYRQSGGYGRQGRSWSSPAGGLYQSLLLRPHRPQAEWPTIALVAACAIREGLLSFACQQGGDAVSSIADSLTVKWPNDLLLGSGKLVGISCESHAGGMCLGMGVNLYRPAELLNINGAASPAYLCDFVNLPINDQERKVNACGDALLASLEHHMHKWENEGFTAFHRQYCEACGLLSEFVQLVLVPGGTLAEGIVRAIDVQGRLVIENPTHDIQAFSSGEVHLRH